MTTWILTAMITVRMCAATPSSPSGLTRTGPVSADSVVSPHKRLHRICSWYRCKLVFLLCISSRIERIMMYTTVLLSK